MEIPTSFWVHGYVPVQLLLVFGVALAVFVAGQYVLKQCGRLVSMFWQGVLIWLTAYGILRWVVSPPLPSSLVYTYMGMVTLATFLYVSATEDGWAQCLRHPAGVSDPPHPMGADSEGIGLRSDSRGRGVGDIQRVHPGVQRSPRAPDRSPGSAAIDSRARRADRSADGEESVPRGPRSTVRDRVGLGTRSLKEWLKMIF